MDRLGAPYIQSELSNTKSRSKAALFFVIYLSMYGAHSPYSSRYAQPTIYVP